MNAKRKQMCEQLELAVRSGGHREHPTRVYQRIMDEVPHRPAGWDDAEPRTLPAEMANDPIFVLIAKAARNNGKGYLIDHLWDVFFYAREALGPYLGHEANQTRRAGEVEK